MEQTGFPFDKAEADKQIAQLQERVDWVDSIINPFIPPKPKQLGTTITKVYKINGDYTKQVSDWLQPSSCEDFEVVGPFNRIEFVPINLDSSVQVTAWLLKNGWQPTEWNYKKDPKTKKPVKDMYGNFVKTSPKLTEDSLDSLDQLGVAGRLIGYRRKCTHKRNQIQGFIKNLRPDGRVPSVVNTLGAETGRMTHSIIANVPAPKEGQFWKPMRKVFSTKAIEGYCIVGGDADQCQVRALAHYMKDDEFTDALCNGKKSEGTDLHSLNANRAGVSRSHAKNVFYGYLFGAGVAKTASQIGCSEKEAEVIRKKFEAGLNALVKLLKVLQKFWKKHGYILAIDGRKIYVKSEHMLLVYLLQSFEAVLMKVALCFVYERIKAEGLDAKLVTMQHDEFQFLVKNEHAERVRIIIENSIEKAGTFIGSDCPIKGEAVIGNNWYETH